MFIPRSVVFFLLPIILFFTVTTCGNEENVQGTEINLENPSLDPVSEDSVVMKQKKFPLRIALFGGSFCLKKGFSSTKKYWEKKLSILVDNYAVSGAGFSKFSQEDNIREEVDLAMDSVTVYDAFVFWSSSNDFLKGSGTRALSDFGVKHQNEGIEYCLKKIRKKYPNVPILWFTSVPVFHLGKIGYSLTENSEKSFNVYVNNQKKICEKWGVPYLDQFSLGLVNERNFKLYTLDDHRHLNPEGYKLYRRIQADFIARNLNDVVFADRHKLSFREKFIELFPLNRFALQAHRGDCQNFPENTILAFEEAGKNNDYSGIETDVAVSADGELLCMHDRTVDRTTDGAGKVSSQTFEELQKLYIDGGNGWSDKFSSSIKIPLLKDYLIVCKKYHKTPYVELKKLSPKDIERVISVIHNAGFLDGTFVLTSFHFEDLIYASMFCDTPLEIMAESFNDKDISKYLKIPNVVFRPRVDKITKGFVEKVNSRGALVECWNLKKGKNVQARLKKWGVEGCTYN